MKVLSQSKFQLVAIAIFVISMIIATIPSLLGLLVDFECFAFPINVIVSVTLLLIAYFCRSVAQWRWFKFAIIVALLGFLVVLGLLSKETIQTILHSWISVCLLLWVLFMIAAMAFNSTKGYLSKTALVGLWLVLLSLTLGECDSHHGSIVARGIGPDNILISNQLYSVLPFTYQLLKTDNESVTLMIIADSDTLNIVVENGKSAQFGSYELTLKSVDGSLQQRFAVIDVYKQPWKYVSYAGMLLVVVGLLAKVPKKIKSC